MEATDVVAKIERDKKENTPLAENNALWPIVMEEIKSRAMTGNISFFNRYNEVKREMVEWLGDIKRIGGYDWLAPEKIVPLMDQILANARKEVAKEEERNRYRQHLPGAHLRRKRF